MQVSDRTGWMWPARLRCSLVLPLDTGGAASCKCPHLFKGGHRGVPRERCKKRAVCPPEPNRFVGRFAVQQPIDKTRGESVPATDPVVHIELALRSCVHVPVDPGYGAP